MAHDAKCLRQLHSCTAAQKAANEALSKQQELVAQLRRSQLPEYFTAVRLASRCSSAVERVHRPDAGAFWRMPKGENNVRILKNKNRDVLLLIFSRRLARFRERHGCVGLRVDGVDRPRLEMMWK